MSEIWYVYILVSRCGRNVTYIGCTIDVARRLRQHNGEIKGGAASTRAARPWEIGRIFGPLTKSNAMSLEAQFKKLNHSKRMLLCYYGFQSI